MSLPTPTFELSPAANGWVNFAEWEAIDPSIWHDYSVTVGPVCNAGGCSTVTAYAAPSYVTWNTGDGSTNVCNGPGTEYDPSVPFNDQSTKCSHTYTESSVNQPSPNGNPNDAAFPVTATITWAVSWDGPDNSGGALPVLTTQSGTTLRVEQIESVNN